jgi:Kef-type K+ transport system membrane component KefB
MPTVAPPLPAALLLHLLIGLVVLLALARLLGSLAQRIGLPAIAGELLTGVVVGPSLLGAVAPDVARWLFPPTTGQMGLLDAVGQLGLLFLVALTGTHLDLGSIRRQARTAATVSLAGLLIPLGCGIGLGLVFAGVLARPDSSASSVFPLFLGVAMCVTAIPVIAKTLIDMGLLHRNIGQLTLAAGMVDDAVGWLLLSLVSAVATAGVSLGAVSMAVASMVAFLLMAVLVGRPLVRWIMTRVVRDGQSASVTSAGALIVLVGAVITHALHMEPVFGAFVAGILLGTTGPAVQRGLAPLRTVTLAVLAPIFLATAGLRMDLTALGRPGVLAAAAAVLGVAIAGKFAGAYLGARLSRLSRWEGLALGAGMNARGVVEVIVAIVGLQAGVLDSAGYTVIVLIAIVTSLMAPPLLRFAMNRIEQVDIERLRAIDHATWAGVSDPTPGPS